MYRRKGRGREAKLRVVCILTYVFNTTWRHL
eukprot:SAG22_NODE_18177_length_291_cov_1.687500_1_plen_30_part_10